MSCVRLACLTLIAGMFVAATDARAAGWVPRPGIEASGSYGTVSRAGADVLDGTYGGGWSATSPRIRSAPIFEGAGAIGDRDITDRYRRVNFVLGGGVSFAWPAHSGRVVANARCGFGLNDLMKSDAIVSRTRTVEVGAGWQW